MTQTLAPGATIAHLIECDGPGGAERVLAHLVTHLAGRGFHNVVMVPAEGEGWLAQQLGGSRVDVVPIPLIRAPVHRALVAVMRVLREFRPAVAHSHEFTMAVIGGLACWLTQTPHVITMHGGRYYATRRHRRIGLALAAAAAHAVVPVSEDLATHLRRDLTPRPRGMRVIANGIPPVAEVAPTLRHELGLPSEARLVVAVGNLYPVKGHRHLVEAIAGLRDGAPVHLAIAGRGDEEQPLRNLAHALGCADRVHLLGLRADIANILRSADAFVLSSVSEGLPLAILEAMRAGVPIVATRVGEVPTVLEDGQAGLLVSPGNSAELRVALERMLRDLPLARRLAQRAETLATTRYGLEHMAGEYFALYSAAARGGAIPAPPRSPRDGGADHV